VRALLGFGQDGAGEAFVTNKESFALARISFEMWG
jgi:hypothetical protein